MIGAEDSEHAVVRKPVKSEAAFRTISEVSEDLDVPQHVLRFWESKFSQIKPLKRGGGRRYYRPEDLVLLKRIRDLLYKDGYTIRGVQKLLRDQSRGQAVSSGARPEETVTADPQEASSDAPPPAPETASTPEAATQAQLALEPAMPAGEGLSSSHRKELQGLLAELLELRSLLAQAHRG